MNFNKLYPYSYEELDKNGGQPQIEVAYNSDGQIGAIFVYNAQIDAMIKCDLNVFEERHSSKFFYLQEKINESLSEANAQNEPEDLWTS